MVRRALRRDLHADFGPEFKLLGIQEAWARTRGSPDVAIAVIDGGVDMDHPLLTGRRRHDQRKANGADFSGPPGQCVPYDGSSGVAARHGTDSAFVIAGQTSERRGCSGVTPSSTLIPVKFHGVGRAHDHDLAGAIEHAAVSGAAIANISHAIPRYLPATRRAIDFAATHDLLIVAAAGNDEGDLRTMGLYPAAFSLDPHAVPNQLVVMSVANDLSSRQTYSGTAVHIAAPIAARTPSDRDGGHSHGSGSSIATAYVAGIAALVKSLNRSWWTCEKLRTHLMESGTEHAALKHKCISGRRVHAGRAINGPLVLAKPPGLVVWDDKEAPTLRWTLLYPSTACTHVVAQLLSDRQPARLIGVGIAQDCQMRLDLRGLARIQGEVRLRSVGSNFQSDVVPVLIR